MNGRPKAVGDIKSPSCINRSTSCEKGQQDDDGTREIEPPGEQVDPWKSHIPCTDLKGEEEISEYGRNGGDDDQKDLNDSMQGENGILKLRAHQGVSRGNKFEA